MKHVIGESNTAKIYTDLVDTTTLGQVRELVDQTFTKDSKIRIMPDCHAGKGCVVGTTMTLADKVVPNLVGVDIGCGVLATKLDTKEISFEKLDEIIHNYVPAGFKIHENNIADFDGLDSFLCPIVKDRAKCSIGTLGGGNHFIELNKDENGDYWLVIHCGSRHLGIEVADYYQKEAERLCKEHVPKDLTYVEGDVFEAYIHDMNLAQKFAALNRETIANVIVRELGVNKVDAFDTIHNYIDTKNMVLRKGAISAQLGEKVIIPMNMRDGSLICVGKGNEDWNCSAPHGAGRILSRTEAKNSLNLEDFKSTMDGIYTTSVNNSTIDEAPMAYKPVEKILENIGDTVDVVETIKPVYNFKAHK
jgi:RNA-splicing ligase RtcB